MALDFFGWAVQEDGLRLSFPVVQNNGEPRTGLIAGDFIITVVNPQDTAVNTPAVSELTQKAGQYTALVPSSFLATHGIGIYHVIIEVDTFSGPSGAPQVRNTFGGPVRISANDFDSISKVHFDGDAASGGFGTYSAPIGGGNPPTALVDRMDAIGAKKAFLKYEADYIRPTAGDWTNKIFEGSNGVYVGIDPNDADFNGSVLRYLSIQSTGALGFGAAGAGFGSVTLDRCQVLGPIAFKNSASMFDCQLATTSTAVFTLSAGQDARFMNCQQFRASNISPAQPVFIDYNSAANTRAIFHRFDGKVIVRNMTQATALLDLHGEFDLEIEATCTAGIIQLRGDGSLKIAAGATVTIQDQRFEDGARIDVQPILLSNNDVETSAVLSRRGRAITTATSATLTIRDNADAVVYTQTINAAPNTHGVYVFSGTPTSAIAPGTYSALISITDGLGTIASQIDLIGAP